MKSPVTKSRVYSIIDIETTGGSRKGNKITEIAIINFDGENIIDEFQTLINPEMRIPSHITRLTGINDQMVADAPKFYEVAKKIVEMTEGNIFVAHNVFFDLNFIKYEFSELGYSYLRDKLCTVRLARKFLPGHKSYSLGNLCDDLGIEISARHRAYGDARATVEVLRLILQKNSNPELIESESKKINLPLRLNREEFEGLPHNPGVYYFYDQNQTLLYIGKSLDIKNRVRSHFRVDLKRTKDIQLKSQIARIEYKKLGNELASLLFECQEIKKLFPKYNTALKRRKFPIALNLIKNQNNSRLELKITTKLDSDDNDYVFKNKRAAKLRMNSFYKALLGCHPENLGFEQARQKLIKSVGIEEYNKMLEKIVYARRIKFKDYDIVQKGVKKLDKCIIQVRDSLPVNMVYIDEAGELLEEVELRPDPDMLGILQSYIFNNKLVINPISERIQL